VTFGGVRNGLLRPAGVVRQVAEAGEDVGAELVILASLGQPERSTKMLLGHHILAGIMRHPAGHLGEAGHRAEHALIISLDGAAKQSRCHRALEVAGHRGVEVATAKLTVGRPQRLHRRKIVDAWRG
jgi:hypothetical protein